MTEEINPIKLKANELSSELCSVQEFLIHFPPPNEEYDDVSSVASKLSDKMLAAIGEELIFEPVIVFVEDELDEDNQFPSMTYWLLGALSMLSLWRSNVENYLFANCREGTDNRVQLVDALRLIFTQFTPTKRTTRIVGRLDMIVTAYQLGCTAVTECQNGTCPQADELSLSTEACTCVDIRDRLDQHKSECIKELFLDLAHDKFFTQKYAKMMEKAVGKRQLVQTSNKRIYALPTAEDIKQHVAACDERRMLEYEAEEQIQLAKTVKKNADIDCLRAKRRADQAAVALEKAAKMHRRLENDEESS